MTEPVTNQFLVFLFTILTGALAGLFYDVYAGIGQVIRLRKIGMLVGDVIFWAVLTPVVFVLLLYYNQGEVRFFVLIGLGVGALVYFAVFRRRIRLLIVQLIELAIKAFKFLIRAICWVAAVLFFPFKVIYQIATFPFKMLGLGLHHTGRGIKTLLKFIIPSPVKRFTRKLINKWSEIIKKLRVK